MATTISSPAKGVNTPTAHAATNAAMAEAAARTGRDVGNYVLLMVIADETDEAAMAKWEHYNDGADLDAMTWLADQAERRCQCGGDQHGAGRWLRPPGRSTSTWARWSAPTPAWPACSTSSPRCPPPRASC